MLSACMIVQDEEECVARALDSLHEKADEIVVIDGGSKDATIEICKGYKGLRVFEIPFTRDFSKQKNHAIERASGDWILWLDADEYYDRYTMEALPRLMESEEYDAYAFSRKTFVDDYLVNLFDPDWQIRLFRSYCRFSGHLHEGVTGFNNRKDCNLDIKHYKKAEWQQKDNELYWDMGQEPPDGWVKVDGRWVWVGVADNG